MSTVETRLREETGLDVVAGSVHKMTSEVSRGLRRVRAWHDLVFLAADSAGTSTDLYRIAVRSLEDETIFAARGLKNLSASPDGDETELKVDPPFVAAATRALGRVRSVSLFDFRGAPDIDNTFSRMDRGMRRITNLLETGHAGGIGKTTVRFGSPPEHLEYEIKGDTLQLLWVDAGGKTSTASVRANESRPQHSNVVVTPMMRPKKQPVLWAVDTVRSLDSIGPGPVEWLEGRVFAMRDIVRRTRYRIFGEEDDDAAENSPDAPMPAELNLPSGLEIGTPVKSEVWPPAPFDPPVFTRRVTGEGTWRPAVPGFVKRLKNAPPAFYSSIVRPDRERPYAKVKLFAMDMRQLELHMVGGIEDPQSTTGSVGDGRIPREKALMERVVAAFNGAFKTEHGAYGMMAAGDVLLPPKADAATVATLKSGRTLMGTWPPGLKIPEQMDSYRQNMDPLVENGVVNPKRRYLWGFTLDTDITKMQTVRSGLCMSDKGYLVYVWGEDVTAQTLGIAMNAVGCTYGLHLDMNPYHTAFIYYQFQMEADGERPEYKSESAIPETMYSPHRYINGAPKDFFFLALKDPSPGPGWSSEGPAQTTPAFMPSVFRKNENGCRMVAAHLDRTAARLVPGDIPTLPASTSPSSDDSDGRRHALLIDVDLGAWSSLRGQTVNGATVAGTLAGAATLGIDERGMPVVAAWPFSPMTPMTDTLQGRWFSKAPSIGGTVIGIGVKADWVILAEGPAGTVRDALAAEGAERPMYFEPSSKPNAPSQVFIRDEVGMSDLAGNRVTETDLNATHLQFYATPKPLGAKRLESMFPPPPSKQTEKEPRHAEN